MCQDYYIWVIRVKQRFKFTGEVRELLFLKRYGAPPYQVFPRVLE